MKPTTAKHSKSVNKGDGKSTPKAQIFVLTLINLDCRCVCMKSGSHLYQHPQAVVHPFSADLPC